MTTTPPADGDDVARSVIRRLPPKLHRRPWTEDEQQLLRVMVAEDCLIGEIAEALRRTREGVRNRANALGLPMRSSPGQGRRRLTPKLPTIAPVVGMNGG